MENIQNFNLFGENKDLPDVVHCETIETRSRVHNWEFQAHRHARLHQFLLIQSGGGTAIVEDSSYSLAPGILINVPTGTVHSFSFLPGTKGWVVTLVNEVIDQHLQESEGLRPLLSAVSIFQSSPAISTVIKQIFNEFHGRNFARAHILRALSVLLVGVIAREINVTTNISKQFDHPLKRDFDALVESHFSKHLNVTEYAGILAVTPTHLSRIMRQMTGKPASVTIDERIVREAKRNLAYSNLNIGEIAYLLGFSDPAYFSRVFLRVTGSTPRSFRARI